MYFSKIVLHNFGIYKGRHCITLHNQNGRRNITLVGGMNGRGKTTILDAVFLCLYGRKATEYITGKKEAYASVLRDRINKSTPDQKTYITLEFALDDDSHAPHAKASAEGNNEGLQSVDSRSEKLHIASLSPGMPRT